MGKYFRGASPLNRILAAGVAVAAITMTVPFALPNASAEARTPAPALLDGEIADFYRSRGGAPLWFAPNAGPAAQ